MKPDATGTMSRATRGCTAIAGCVLLMLGIAGFAGAQQSGAADKTSVDGQRIYRDGILPSGKPMTVRVEGGAAVPGITFACGSCHNRSGLAVMDPTQRVPSINGPTLYRPLYHFFPALSADEREELPERFKTPPLRSEYTDATLANAIREGVDPNGRRFNATMPRYNLDDADIAILIKYLKQLSSTPSPGVTDTTLALATVVTDDVSEQDRAAMLAPLDKMVRTHNTLGRSGNMSSMLNMQVMYLSFREYTLAHWTLTGPPDTWREQLEDLYKKNPIFAIVGGISNNLWKPVHDFCEDHQIPCILPITDLPEISRTDYYTLYFSEGQYKEGEAIALYLANAPEMKESADIVQVVGPGPHAQALASGFESAWKAVNGKPVRTVRLGRQERLTAQKLSALSPRGKASALLLWLGPEAYEPLRELARSAHRPAYVFLSSTLLAERMWELPLEARGFTYLAYPFREPGPKTVPPKMGGRPIVVNKEFRKNDRRIASKTETIITLLNNVVGQMERNFYRDYLLDLFDSMEVYDRSDYELLDFGPRRRYLSESCYIMRLSEEANPKLVRVSDAVGP